MTQKAPKTFQVGLHTSKGIVVIDVYRDWAPRGADRFFNLVRYGFYDDARFFRVIRSFMTQFGIPGDPKLAAVWKEAKMPDDPALKSNLRGTITFATAGPNTRTTQLFINTVDNSRLDNMGFAPFGRVVRGMDVVDQLYADYGEGAPAGKGPSQKRIHDEGNEYLERDFPKLDFIKRAVIHRTSSPRK